MIMEMIVEDYQQDLSFIFADNEDKYISLQKSMTDDSTTSNESVRRADRFESIYPDVSGKFKPRRSGIKKFGKGERVDYNDDNEGLFRRGKWQTFPDRKRERNYDKGRKYRDSYEG